MNTIYGILSEGELRKVCDPVKYNIRYRNFQKFKDIFDLSEIYNNYRLHFIKVNPSCDKNYDDAINSYQVLYNSLRNECTIENTNYHEEYCEVFREHFPNEKHSEISSWKCKLQEPEEQDQQLVEEPTDDSRKDQMPERPEKIVEQRNHLPGLLQTRQFVEHPSALHPGLHTGNTYTPAGTWISKLLGMNKGSNRNPYANQELMENFSMPEDFYSERNRYNIMYNPE
ncbi:hypothetical protein PVIIG_06429 [Plasmodium vivax India VII]|uniref:VIR protein n=1 Tax=Plasmodium vivax India VII TaxID=1077284 RepID=A0A0J9S3B2_PLAVI|nr:hypothetical protein PVIIG_06429 [Plasmodium vivax India VII]